MNAAKANEIREQLSPYAAVEVSAADVVIPDQPDPTPAPKDGKDALPPAGTTVSEKPEEKAAEAPTEEEAPPAEPEFELDGKKFSQSQLLDALKDSENKKEWQKANTQRDQETAALRKAIDPMVKLVEKLKSKGETLDEIRNILTDEFGEDDAALINAAIEFDEEKYPHPLKTQITEKEERAAQLEAELALRDEKDALRRKHRIADSTVDKALEYAINYHKEHGVALDLEGAYKLMKADEKPPPPPPPPPGPGAKNIAPESKPIPRTYADISLEGLTLQE